MGTLLLERRTMDSLMNLAMSDNEDGNEDNDDSDSDTVEVTHEDNEAAKDELSVHGANKEDEADKEKKPLWRKPQKKKGGKKGGGGQKKKGGKKGGGAKKKKKKKKKKS